MRIKAILVGLLLLAQWSCSEENSGPNDFRDDSSITSLNGTWKVKSFEDHNTGIVEYKTQENSWNLDIIVTFDDTKNPHELTGTNTTNEISGEFDYVGQRELSVSDLFSTEVGQPAWADKFIDALIDNDATFKINNEQLRIYFDNNTKSVTLIKE